MKLKEIIQVSFFLILPLFLSGQSEGFSIGWGYGFGYSNIKNHTFFKNRYNSKPSSSSILFFNYQWNNTSSIEVGLGIEQKGGSYQSIERKFTTVGNTIIPGDTVKTKITNEFLYFTIPITYNRKILTFKRNEIFVGIGGYYSQLISERWNRTYLDFFTLLEEGSIDFDYKNWDAGLQLNVGIDFPIGKVFGLKTTFDYSRGLINFIGSSEQNKANHQRIYGQIKCYFKLRKLKR